jgi:hypothetical protein
LRSAALQQRVVWHDRPQPTAQIVDPKLYRTLERALHHEDLLTHARLSGIGALRRLRRRRADDPNACCETDHPGSHHDIFLPAY